MPRRPTEIICQVCSKKKSVTNPKQLFCSNTCRGNYQSAVASGCALPVEEREPTIDVPPPTPDELLQISKLKAQITSLRSDLKEVEKRALTSDVMVELIQGMQGATFEEQPKWLFNEHLEMHGIPTLFLSDIHFDEYVDPAQIGHVNEYNREIATDRINHTFKSGIDILMNYTANPKYDGIVVALGGDLLSGNIHEELSESNEAPILQSLLELTGLLKNGIGVYAETFGKVFVPCVVGNHGRLHKKPRAKNRVFDNFEWLIYQNLAREFRDDPRVTFLIPDGPDAQFTVYNTNFLLTHGDQFRGGNGISGIFTPLMMGAMKKQKKLAAVGRSFEVMMCGHFHQYIHTNSLIVNGTIKGYDEWVNLMNFSFERPQQSLWINHPENGMVFRTPILCDSYQGARDSLKNKTIRLGK